MESEVDDILTTDDIVATFQESFVPLILKYQKPRETSPLGGDLVSLAKGSSRSEVSYVEQDEILYKK